MKFSTTYTNVHFPNPLVLASGILGVTGNSLKWVAEHGAGGVTTKSIWLSEHIGHPNPTMIATEHFMLNAVGVPDAGIEKAQEEIAHFQGWSQARPEGLRIPLIVNIIANTITRFGETAEKVAELKPDLIEVNVSCPNVEDEFGKPFACDRHQAAQVTREVKERTGGKIPVIVKLSPNVTNIVEIAKAVEEAGADGLTAFNTFGPGMAINIETAQPILANRVGGLSGPAIKPLVVKMIYDLYAAVKIPILGTGGVLTGRDALELMMAGASLVGIGTGVYYRGVQVFQSVLNEMEAWCQQHGVETISEVVGRAHRV